MARPGRLELPTLCLEARGFVQASCLRTVGWPTTASKQYEEVLWRGYDADVMGQIDEQRERKRLVELYAGMEKGELEEIARDAGSLTPVAREALRTEMLSRGMEAPPANAGAAETSASKDEAPSPVVIARYGGVPEAVLGEELGC